MPGPRQPVSRGCHIKRGYWPFRLLESLEHSKHYVCDPDFGVRLLATEFKTSLTSAPYRGDAPLVQDLVAGHIPASIGTVGG